MTALVVVETVVLLVLVVLVAGLLRSHAAILRRLHELDDPARNRSQRSGEVGFRPMPGMPDPVPLTDLEPASDIAGADLNGDAVALRLVDVEHDTLIAFLSSGCTTCQRFWRAFGDPTELTMPAGTRLVVAVKDVAEESPSTLAQLAPPGVTVVHSSRAFADYRVPGSPYFAFVDGRTGMVRGEGTGLDWEQVASLLAQATGDLRFTMGEKGARVRKPQSDAERELDLDRALLSLGIGPGDPSLYESRPGPESREAESNEAESIEAETSTDPGRTAE